MGRPHARATRENSGAVGCSRVGMKRFLVVLIVQSTPYLAVIVQLMLFLAAAKV
jgi:hypothetical protein